MALSQGRGGAWDAADCALLLMDYKDNVLGTIFEQDRRVVELNVRTLATYAQMLDIPVVLTTVAVQMGVNGPTIPSLQAALPDLEPIDRSERNAWRDPEFLEAVRVTGRQRLVMGGISTSVCLTYPADLVIATKAGFERPGPGSWEVNGKPEHLKAQAEKSLGLLGLERIELFQLHRIDPHVPLADQLGALIELQAEGKIGRIGLSEVSVAQIQAARAITPIVTVQNRFNLAERSAEPVLDYCERAGIGFIPWFPMATGRLARPGGRLQRMADEHDVTPAQLALSWLLARSPVLLPIPGTSTAAHLEENIAAALIELSPDQVQQLDAAI